ncbi:MAG TPA: ribonuclease H-like domain-containing protein [Planctomycetota bacterium]|nr:ribonuclease H-like domain-containing protein [Planctomycetota bacterium]
MSGTFEDKLARLGVTRGPAVGGAPPEARPSPLAFGRNSAAPPPAAPKPPPFDADWPAGLRERLRRAAQGGVGATPSSSSAGFASRPAPGALRATARGLVHVAEWSTPRDAVHGRVALDACADARAVVAAAAARDARFLGADLRDWAFFDTETTSLNAGAGVWVFLVGVGRFVGGDFRVRQFLLVGPDGEEAFLEAVREELADAAALVSFHGKSFDAPRLDDRCRLSAAAELCARRPHWDLLHATRRLFGRRWPDCRLRTVEEELLGFRRSDDLPGAECPAHYFAYLRGRPHRLADVFEHNRYDVVSLAALAGTLSAAYRAAPGCPHEAAAVGLDWAEAGREDVARPYLLHAVPAAGQLLPTTKDKLRRALRRIGEGAAAATLRAAPPAAAEPVGAAAAGAPPGASGDRPFEPRGGVTFRSPR